jgi:hypothetical protein
VGMVLANGIVNGIDKGAHKGGGFCKDHGVSRPSMLHKLLRIKFISIYVLHCASKNRRYPL